MSTQHVARKAPMERYFAVAAADSMSLMWLMILTMMMGVVVAVTKAVK